MVSVIKHAVRQNYAEISETKRKKCQINC